MVLKNVYKAEFIPYNKGRWPSTELVNKQTEVRGLGNGGKGRDIDVGR